MILLDQQELSLGKASHVTQVAGLKEYYHPAEIMVTKAIGDIGSLSRYPVRARVERGGFILIHIARLDRIERWFDRRNELTTKLLTYDAIQSWIVITGLVEGNLFGTIGDTSIEASVFDRWLTEARMSGCIVATVKDEIELEALCATVESVLVNSGQVRNVLSVEHLFSTIPHIGPITDSIINYCGSVWAGLAFITNKDLFKTLSLNPKARVALGDGYFTRKMHSDVRKFLGLEPEDYGLGLYLEKD